MVTNTNFPLKSVETNCRSDFSTDRNAWALKCARDSPLNDAILFSKLTKEQQEDVITRTFHGSM